MARPFPLQLGFAKALLVAVALALCFCSALSYRPLLRRGLASPNTTEEFLDPQNEARAAVGVPPLRWSSNISGDASRLARYQRNEKNCEFASLSQHKYGQNQAWASWQLSPRQAVENWVAEKRFYNYTSNSCEPSHFCGVYTQVVWNTSVELGCGQATCKSGATLTICFYSPPGNFVGERPY